MASILLAAIIGLLVGYYARTMYDRVSVLIAAWKEKFDAHEAGVVKPSVSRVTRNAPINLESDAGGVMRPTPNQVALDAMAEREKRLKRENT